MDVAHALYYRLVESAVKGNLDEAILKERRSCKCSHSWNRLERVSRDVQKRLDLFNAMVEQARKTIFKRSNKS